MKREGRYGPSAREIPVRCPFCGYKWQPIRGNPHPKCCPACKRYLVTFRYDEIVCSDNQEGDKT